MSSELQFAKGWKSLIAVSGRELTYSMITQKEKERAFENEWEKNKELEDEDISRRECGKKECDDLKNV